MSDSIPDWCIRHIVAYIVKSFSLYEIKMFPKVSVLDVGCLGFIYYGVSFYPYTSTALLDKTHKSRLFVETQTDNSKFNFIIVW